MSDWIKRSDAIEAVMAEGRKVYTSEYASAERIIHEADAVEALSMLPSAEGGDADMTVIPEGTGLMKPCPDNGADLISRQDAIEAVCEWGTAEERNGNLTIAMASVKQDVADILSALPSAEAVQIPIKLEKRYPESKDEDITDAFMRGYLAGRSSAEAVQGEWIRKNYHTYICNQCGYEEAIYGNVEEYRFCSHCGAKMMTKGGDNNEID